MTDKILTAVIILSLIFTTHLLSYELGKSAQCNSDRDYRYSLDMGICYKVGSINIKGGNDE